MLSRKIGSAMLVAGVAVWAASAQAAAPAPYGVTPQLVQAAQKEGKVVFYTTMDVKLAEKLAQAFEQKYPGIKVDVERSGAERNFQRVTQEYGAGIYNADVFGSTDAMNFVYFKQKGWLQAAVPTDVASWPADAKDPDGDYAALRVLLSVMSYNTQLVKPGEAPTSYKDLLDPKWKGKIVKANPSYSGTIMTATYVLSKALGWGWFKQLGQQDVMQVQSSLVPPQKVAQGERAIAADGSEETVLGLQDKGAPIKPIYPAEGTPLVIANAAVFKKAAHPNAARLFYHYIFSLPAQQLFVTVGDLRSFHPGVKEKASHTPLSKIKLLHSDPQALVKDVQSIKQHYLQDFGV